MAKPILVTGGEGFIGSHLIRLFPDRFENANVDVCDLPALRTRIQISEPSAIFHMAGISTVAQCEADPELASQINVQGTQNVLQALVDEKSRARFYFFSTAQVYEEGIGENLPNGITEDCKLSPLNFYAETKLLAEQIVSKFSKQIPSVIFRLFNHVHHSQHAGFLVHLYRELNKRKETGPANSESIPVGNLDLYRDMGAITDLLRALVATVNAEKRLSNLEILNISSGRKRLLSDLAQILSKQMAVSANFVPDPSRFREKDPKVICGNHEKITELTRWSPRIASNEELIRSFLETTLHVDF